MDDHHPEIVIIKRHSGHEEEHHGGAWKIAFADFMTAMMAFFLVLWIINATDKNTKTIIARYFNPVKLENPARAGKGLLEESRPSTKKDSADTPTTATDGNAKKEDGKTTGASSDAKGKSTAGNVAGPVDPANPKATMSESALFKDPYASLDQIVSRLDAPPAADRTPMEAGADLEAPRDPFKPITIGGDDDYLGDAKPVATRAPEQAQAKASSRPNSSSSSQPPKKGAQSEHGAQTAQSVSPDGAASSGQGAGTGQLTPSKASAASAPAPLTSGAPAKTSHARHARQDTTAEAAQLRKDLTKEIATVAASQPGPGVEVKATDDGILISLTDQLNFSMFPIGSAEPQPKVVRIMEKIAQSLKGRPGEIILRGHTDGRPYKSATYDNWRLSSARAQMAYYMLVRGGLSKTRFERIEGYGDRRLKNSREPYAAENRRIEILLRKEKP